MNVVDLCRIVEAQLEIDVTKHKQANSCRRSAENGDRLIVVEAA